MDRLGIGNIGVTDTHTRTHTPLWAPTIRFSWVLMSCRGASSLPSPVLLPNRPDEDSVRLQLSVFLGL